MTNLYVTLPDDFAERLTKYREKVLGVSTKTIISNLAYDAATCILTLGGKSIKIPRATNQSALCGILFSEPIGAWVQGIDIRSHLMTEGERNLYDAVIALNKKVKDEWGIEGLFEFEGEAVRVVKEIVSH